MVDKPKALKLLLKHIGRSGLIASCLCGWLSGVTCSSASAWFSSEVPPVGQVSSSPSEAAKEALLGSYLSAFLVGSLVLAGVPVESR